MKVKRIAKVFSFIFLGLLLLSYASVPNASAKNEAKHVILFIGDGMNIEHEIATSRYLFGKNFGLSFHKLQYEGDMATWDVSTYNKWAAALSKPAYDPKAIEPHVGYDPDKGGKRPYPLGPELAGAEDYHKFAATDSASAATAWATGYKTDDGNIAWLPGDPDDGALKTIAQLLRAKRGYAIGVVSTVPFTHATPAAHVSHNKSRNNYYTGYNGYTGKGIAEEIVFNVKLEVVIGGGHPTLNNPTWDTTKGYISKKVYNALKASSDYVFVERMNGVDGGVSLLEGAQQAVKEGKKLFGLFGGVGGNFDSMEPYDLPGTPLVTSETRENPSLAEASIAALKVLSQDPDGFFVMIEQGDIDWANHANDFQRMVGTTKDLHDAVQAVIDFVNQPGDDMDWDNTLMIVTADHSNSYMRLKVKLSAGDLPRQEGVGSCGYGGPACTYPDNDVTYGSTSHTNELVRLYAMGVGTQAIYKYEGEWYPFTRLLDNTQLFHIMMEAAGEAMRSPLILK
jgi:alkaline phosphatase